MYGNFNQETGEIALVKTWIWIGKAKRETKALLIAAQNNSIRINNMKMKIDDTLTIF